MRALLTLLAISLASPLAACGKDGSEAESAATIPLTIAMAGTTHRFNVEVARSEAEQEQGTKAGIDHVVRCIAHEFGHQGVRANSIAPGGVVDAPMSGGGLMLDSVAALYRREVPLGRSTRCADVADAALWLASEEASFITGQTIHVSGGQTLRRNPSIGEVYAAYGMGS